jgi:hypothetical protein
MRVAIFIDAKYFYDGWRDDTGRRDLDFSRLAKWIVSAVGGTRFMGAHYYAGVDYNNPSHPIQAKVAAFLDGVADIPGFFVGRFEQRTLTRSCEGCGNVGHKTQAPGLKGSVVADMIRLAAKNGFDTAVLVADDADYAPALEAVRGLGKRACVAVWSRSDAEKRLTQVAFEVLELRKAMSEFGLVAGQASGPLAELVGGATVAVPPFVFSNDPAVHEAALLGEIHKAQMSMPNGFVGAHFFVTKWKSERLPEIPDFRRRTLDRVVAAGKAEIYLTEDGIQAVRVKS